jgi:hypothetical protein
VKVPASFIGAIAAVADLLSACSHGDSSVAAFSPSLLPPRQRFPRLITR